MLPHLRPVNSATLIRQPLDGRRELYTRTQAAGVLPYFRAVRSGAGGQREEKGGWTSWGRRTAFPCTSTWDWRGREGDLHRGRRWSASFALCPAAATGKKRDRSHPLPVALSLFFSCCHLLFRKGGGKHLVPPGRPLTSHAELVRGGEGRRGRAGLAQLPPLDPFYSLYISGGEERSNESSLSSPRSSCRCSSSLVHLVSLLREGGGEGAPQLATGQGARRFSLSLLQSRFMRPCICVRGEGGGKGRRAAGAGRGHPFG